MSLTARLSNALARLTKPMPLQAREGSGGGHLPAAVADRCPESRSCGAGGREPWEDPHQRSSVLLLEGDPGFMDREGVSALWVPILGTVSLRLLSILPTHRRRRRCLDAVWCDTGSPGARGSWDMGEAGPGGDAAAPPGPTEHLSKLRREGPPPQARGHPDRGGSRGPAPIVRFWPRLKLPHCRKLRASLTDRGSRRQGRARVWGPGEPRLQTNAVCKGHF